MSTASTPDERAARIEEIRELLATGIASTTIEGFSVTINHASLRDELRRLEAIDAPARPYARNINLMNFGT